MANSSRLRGPATGLAGAPRRGDTPAPVPQTPSWRIARMSSASWTERVRYRFDNLIADSPAIVLAES